MTPATLYHTQALSFFGEQAAEQAAETHFVRRRSPLDGPLFLLSLVLTVYRHGRISLSLLAATAETLRPETPLTEQAFKERFSAAAVAFLQAMFALALTQTLPQSQVVTPLLGCFAAIYVLDATSIRLPATLAAKVPGCGGAGPSAMLKCYLLLEWLTGSYQAWELQPGRKADQDMGARFVPDTVAGALWLFDLGFFSGDFLRAVAQAHSYFLCRLPANYGQLQVQQADGVWAKWDLDRFLRCAPRQLFELAVRVSTKEPLPVRLILAPVPLAVAQERRRKLRATARKQGRTPQAATLARCGWTLLLTNAPEVKLPTSVCLTVYRVRWQVELVFKLWKGEAGLRTTLAQEKHRAECEIYAKFIALLYFNRLLGMLPGWLRSELSEVKAWQQLKCEWGKYWGSLRSAAAVNRLEALCDLVGRRAVRHKRGQKAPGTRKLLAQAESARKLVRLKNPWEYLSGREQRDGSGKAQWELEKYGVVAFPGFANVTEPKEEQALAA